MQQVIKSGGYSEVQFNLNWWKHIMSMIRQTRCANHYAKSDHKKHLYFYMVPFKYRTDLHFYYLFDLPLLVY